MKPPRGNKSRDSLRDDAALVCYLLLTRKRISLAGIAQDMNKSQRTARCWVNSFGKIMMLRVEQGIVIRGDADPQEEEWVID